jgi:hypothetical protein
VSVESIEAISYKTQAQAFVGLYVFPSIYKTFSPARFAWTVKKDVKTTGEFQCGVWGETLSITYADLY